MRIRPEALLLHSMLVLSGCEVAGQDVALHAGEPFVGNGTADNPLGIRDGAAVAGVGTAGTLAMFTSNGVIANSGVVQNADRVGVGTPSPVSAFHLSASQATGVELRIENQNAGASAWSGLTVANDKKVTGAIFTGSTGYGPLHSGRLVVRGYQGLTLTAADPTADIRLYAGGEDTFAEHARLTADGRLGLGTTNPLGKLHIVTDSINGNNGSWTTGAFVVGAEGNDGGVGIYYDRLAHRGQLEAARPGVSGDSLILNSSGGNVGIGTLVPNYRLVVADEIGIARKGKYGVVVYDENGTDTCWRITVGGGNVHASPATCPQ